MKGPGVARASVRGTDPRMEPEPPRWPKTCRCGEDWSRVEWSELPPIGRYLAGSDGWIELRTCLCGGTLVVPAVDLDRDDASDVSAAASS